MFRKRIRSTGLLFASMALLVLSTSCAREIDPNVYSAGHIGETMETYRGIIVSARAVIVEDKEYLEENGMGMMIGGAAGGVAGNQMGKGSGKTATTVGGALLGATLGALAEKKLKQQNAMEYVVELEDGRLQTVVQGPNPQYSPGQRILLLIGQKGRSRIQPLSY